MLVKNFLGRGWVYGFGGLCEFAVRHTDAPVALTGMGKGERGCGRGDGCWVSRAAGSRAAPTRCTPRANYPHLNLPPSRGKEEEGMGSRLRGSKSRGRVNKGGFIGEGLRCCCGRDYSFFVSSFFLGGGNEPVFVRNLGFVCCCGGNEWGGYRKGIRGWMGPPVGL